MKKLFLLLAISSLAIFTSCENDEVSTVATENLTTEQSYEEVMDILSQNAQASRASKLTVAQVKSLLHGGYGKWMMDGYWSRGYFKSNGTYQALKNESDREWWGFPLCIPSLNNGTYSLQEGLVLKPAIGGKFMGSALAGLASILTNVVSPTNKAIILNVAGRRWIVEGISQSTLVLRETSNMKRVITLRKTN